MHCPASGIRGTVYPVVYGKSEIFKLFHNVGNIFVPSLSCELTAYLNGTHITNLFLATNNSKLYESIKLGNTKVDFHLIFNEKTTTY